MGGLSLYVAEGAALRSRVLPAKASLSPDNRCSVFDHVKSSAAPAGRAGRSFASLMKMAAPAIRKASD